MANYRLTCPFCNTVVETAAADRADVHCGTCGRVCCAPPLAVNVEYGWFFTDDRKKVGPVSWEKLQERAQACLLKPGDMIRQEGNQKWQVAETVPGLFVSQAGAASASASKGKKKRRWVIGAAAVLFLALAFLWLRQPARKNPKKVPPADAVASTPEREKDKTKVNPKTATRETTAPLPKNSERKETKTPAKAVRKLPEKLELTLFPNAGPFVTALARDLDGNIWAGTEDKGVFRYDANAPAGKQWTQFTSKNGLGDDNAYAVACDKLGRVWVGTLNRGVSVYNGKDWKTYDVLDGPIGERIFDIACCPTDGDVWLATSAGLTRYSLKNDDWIYYTQAEGLPEDQANSIAFDAEGAIYIGTQCHGIARAQAADNYHSWKTTPGLGPDQLPVLPKGEGLPSCLVNKLLVDRDGTLHAATCAGLAWSKDKGETWHYLRGRDYAEKVRRRRGGPPKEWKEASKEVLDSLLPEDFVTCLAEDEGLLWVGFRQQGVLVLDSSNHQPLLRGSKKTGKSPDDYVFALLAPADGKPFIGTYGGGLGQLKPPKDQAKQATLEPRTEKNAQDRSVTVLPAPTRPPSATALQALLKKSTASAPASVGDKERKIIALPDDWRTQGNFHGEDKYKNYRYGEGLALLCAHSSPADAVWGRELLNFRCEARTGSNARKDDSLRHWIQWLNTDNVRSLKNPFRGGRRQAEWDDHGEDYPMTHEGPHLYVDVKVPAGDCYLSLYFFNKDGHAANNRFRDYVLTVKPSCKNDAEFAQAPLLARSRVRDFWGGVYKVFVVEGNQSYTIQIHDNLSFNTVVSGVFFDPVCDTSEITATRFDLPRVRHGFDQEEVDLLTQSIEGAKTDLSRRALTSFKALAELRYREPMLFPEQARRHAPAILRALAVKPPPQIDKKLLDRMEAECFNWLRHFDRRDAIHDNLAKEVNTRN